MLCDLMCVCAPCSEGGGTKSGGQVIFLRRSAEAQRLTMLSLGPTFDIMSSETPLVVD